MELFVANGELRRRLGDCALFAGRSRSASYEPDRARAGAARSSTAAEHPTLEVDVVLESGALGAPRCPPACRPGAMRRWRCATAARQWGGRGVRSAVASVVEQIGPRIVGLEASDREALDTFLVEWDGTSALVRLGANAILGVSLAAARRPPPTSVSRCGATSAVPTRGRFRSRCSTCWREGCTPTTGCTVQEIMVVPLAAPTFSEALRIGVEVYHELGHLLLARGLGRALGDEGGYAPRLASAEEALDLASAAIAAAGYEPGVDVGLALDIAASELRDGRGYR